MNKKKVFTIIYIIILILTCAFCSIITLKIHGILAHKYYEGDGLKQDYDKAYYHISRAYKMGDHSVLYLLGEMYEYGNGVDKNLDKAFEYYQAAQGFGDQNSAVSMKRILMTGIESTESNTTYELFYPNKVTVSFKCLSMYIKDTNGEYIPVIWADVEDKENSLYDMSNESIYLYDDAGNKYSPILYVSSYDKKLVFENLLPGKYHVGINESSGYRLSSEVEIHINSDPTYKLIVYVEDTDYSFYEEHSLYVAGETERGKLYVFHDLDTANDDIDKYQFMTDKYGYIYFRIAKDKNLISWLHLHLASGEHMYGVTYININDPGMN